MMSVALDALNEKNRVRPISHPVSPRILRQRRATLAAAWRRVSCAIEVLTLDLEILSRHTHAVDRVQAIVDELPDLLACSWEFDEPRVPLDTSDLIAADATQLLDLHREMVCSDLDDQNVARSLLVRMKVQRSELTERKHSLQTEITQTKGMLLRQYAAGTASADDWLA
jgi:hypothetical protein